MIGLNLLRAGALAAALLLARPRPRPWPRTPSGPRSASPCRRPTSLFKAKKYREALAKVAEADAASRARPPYETYVIQRTRGSIAAAAGDNDTAARAFEAVIASGRITGAEQLKLIQAVAGLHYHAKDYAKAAQWAARYQKEGGTDPAMRTLLVQSYFLLQRLRERLARGRRGRRQRPQARGAGTADPRQLLPQAEGQHRATSPRSSGW